ncbi:MAG: carboxypeptidase-like regulatory domain-containing protein [Arcticibacter sp.]
MKTILFNLFCLFFLLSPAIAQTGSIKGIIKEQTTGMGLPGASVVIDGTTNGAMTDINGNFEIRGLKAGTYVLKTSYVGFVSETSQPIKVVEGESASYSIALKENINQLQGAEVVSTRRYNTENAVMMEMRKSEVVSNGVSAQQISKSQDRTATDVVRRLPGVTVQDNGFVFVRGLAERYNVTLLNGVSAPSMDADKRAFALDVIPSAMLDRLVVVKTGSPELPGDFSGGLVRIHTRDVSDDNQIQVGYTTGIRVGTTFSEFYQAPKGSTDWLGADDGTRALPGFFPSNLYDVKDPKALANLGKALPNNWAAVRTKAGMDQRFSATAFNNFKFGKTKAANVTSIQYGLTYDSYHADNFSYNAYDPINEVSDTIYDYDDETYKENVRLSLLHNWTFLLSPSTKLEFRNFLNQQGSNQAVLRTGSNFEEGSLVKSYAFRYQQRTVYSGQLAGSHDLMAGTSKIDWVLGYGYSNTSEPDFRRIRTKKDINAVSDSIPYQVIIAPSASTLDAGRFYSNLMEHTGTVGLNFTKDLKSRSEDLMPKFKCGLYSETRVRSFDARWMSYKQSKLGMFNNSLLLLPLDQIFAPDNINDTTGFKLEEGTNPSDSYDASNMLLAGYTGISWPFSKRMNVSGGLRFENNRQMLSSRDYSNRKVEIDNMVPSLLPSINMGYALNDRSQVRLAYFKSVNRPEFRELAPFAYYDFTFNNVLTGNPDLKTPSIHNMDVRYEFYPSNGEMLSVGLFHKVFNNPIEMFFVPGSGGGGTRNFTFGNAEGATSTGLEFEIKKTLKSSVEGLPLGKWARFLARTGVNMNLTWIRSEVNLGDDAVGQESSRPMTGQSPYMINAGIFHNNQEADLQISLMYNIVGKRVFAVGTYGTPDIYFMPRNSVDLTITKGLGKYTEIKFGVQDLFSQDELYKQDSNGNGSIDSKDEDVYRINRGAYISTGVSFKF